MQAMRGVYKNGIVSLDESSEAEGIKVMVIFPTEIDKIGPKERSRKEALQMLKDFKGCLKWEGEFDFEKEKDVYLEEKYGSLN